MVKRIKVYTPEALKDKSYRFPGNYGVEKYLEIFSGESKKANNSISIATSKSQFKSSIPFYSSGSPLHTQNYTQHFHL